MILYILLFRKLFHWFFNLLFHIFITFSCKFLSKLAKFPFSFPNEVSDP